MFDRGWMALPFAQFHVIANGRKLSNGETGRYTLSHSEYFRPPAELLRKIARVHFEESINWMIQFLERGCLFYSVSWLT